MRSDPSTGKGRQIIMGTEQDCVYGRKKIHPK